MIVVSVTTHEPRLSSCRRALEAVAAQEGVDRWLLLVAPTIAAAARQLVEHLPFEVQPVEDIGPGKKHLASRFCFPSDAVVTLDDDHLYTPDHVQVLVRALRHQPTGYGGYRFPDLAMVTGGDADFLNGASGWCYRAGWLDTERVLEHGHHPQCWHSDDVYVGALFADRGCQVLSASATYQLPYPHTAAQFAGALANHPERVQRTRDCLSVVGERFRYGRAARGATDLSPLAQERSA